MSAFSSAMIVLPPKNKTHFRFQTKHNFIKQKNVRFILQKVWNKIKISIKSNNFESRNFLRFKRTVKVINCPSVLYSDLEVRKILVLIIKHLKCFLHFKFQTNLSIFGYSQSYSNEFLLKIETGLSLECDMSLFFSGNHQCLKYLTKTVSPINLNIFLDSQ